MCATLRRSRITFITAATLFCVVAGTGLLPSWTAETKDAEDEGGGVCAVGGSEGDAEGGGKLGDDECLLQMHACLSALADARAQVRVRQCLSSQMSAY